MTREDEMQVVSYAGAGKTRLELRPRPRPAAGELLLRLRACGLCGTDLFKLGADSLAAGAVLGHEVVGSVVAAGSGARGSRGPAAAGHGGRFEEGDRVVVAHHVPCGDCHLCRRGSGTMCAVFRENLLEPGGFSEYVLVRERAVRLAAHTVPQSVSDEAAVFLEPSACVLRGIRRSGLEGEGSALVVGAGSMGLLHVLVLRALPGAFRVFAVDPIAERRDLAVRLGADAAWHPSESAAGLGQSTDGLGVDAVFDTVGGSSVLESCLPLTREGGSVILFAHARPGEKGGLDLNELFKAERRVIGTYSSVPHEQAAVYELLAAGRLDPSPLVTARLPLSRFDEAVERTRTRRDLKVLLYPAEEAP